MKKAILVLFGFPLLAFGQQKEDKYVVQGSDLLMTRSPMKDRTVDGCPYIEKEFLQAKANENNKIYALRYNAYADEIEFMSGDDVLYLNKIEGLKVHFLINNKTYIFKDYIDEKGNIAKAYLVELVNEPSKYSLYKRESIAKVSGINGLNSYQSSKNDYYERLKDLFIIEYNNKYYSFPSNAKKLPTEISDLARDYQKTNKFKITEEGLIKLLNYLNEK